MAVTSFQDFGLADADREWDGDAADKRVRKWAGAEDEPNQKYRDAYVWYDADNKDNFTGVQAADLRSRQRQTRGRAARDHGGRRGSPGCSRRRRHSGFGCGSSEEPPCEVLPQDGSHASLGGLRPPTLLTTGRIVPHSRGTIRPVVRCGQARCRSPSEAALQRRQRRNASRYPRAANAQ